MTSRRHPSTRVRTLASVAVICGSLMAAGCAQRAPDLYHWGSYESQVYAQYNDPGKVPPEQQLEKLEADYQKARAANKAVPPGYHAHMGYLYFQLGKADQAVQSFQTEASLFPESKPYMDRLTKQIAKKK